MVEADETAWFTLTVHPNVEHTSRACEALMLHLTAAEDESTAAVCACFTPTVCAASKPETNTSATFAELDTAGRSAPERPTTPARESRYCWMDSLMPSTSVSRPLIQFTMVPPYPCSVPSVLSTSAVAELAMSRAISFT